LSYSFFDTKEVIENIIRSFKDVEISYTLVNISIWADYVRFKQLVYNLLSNAVKFIKTSPVIQIITYVEDGDFCFQITDNGEGISEEYFDKIFDIFLQVSKDNLKRQIGSGIGLSLCKSIVDAHKGKIYVESKVGVGSMFTFKIPIDKV
jgi:signal transduction histidine kinase